MFTKFANPNNDIGTANVHIIVFIVLYTFLLFLLTFSKKLYPSEIAVVNIAINIVILYKYLYIHPNLFYIYNIGISTCLSIFINNK